MKRSNDVRGLLPVLVVNVLGLLMLAGVAGYVWQRDALLRDSARQSRWIPLPAQSVPSPEPEPGDGPPALFSGRSYSLALLGNETERELAAYGKRLVDETFLYLGPRAPEERLRYAGNELACKNCHLDSGLKPYAASYVGVTKRYPEFRSRENRVGTIEDRINGCMERSMNGKALPDDGQEMKAIVAYMNLLSLHVSRESPPAERGFVKLALPNRAANLDQGARVFRQSCASCHAEDARGRRTADGRGYQYPPLAGPDSYNTGAGMHRVLTATAFIKANMPLGATAEQPFLSDDEAFDVAAYINSLERPTKAESERDYPELKLKPLSTPYPPYADDFPAEQHKFGPFAPIYDYYFREYGLKKSN